MAQMPQSSKCHEPERQRLHRHKLSQFGLCFAAPKCGGKEQLEELSSDKAMRAQETLPLIVKVLKEAGSPTRGKLCVTSELLAPVSTRMGREQLLAQFD